jgi:hypothetical protein
MMAKPLTDNSFAFQTNLGTVEVTASNPAQLNQLWGGTSSQLGQTGIMGEHSSSHGVFTPDPGDGGRDGVGNVTKDNEDFQNPEGDGNNLSQGGQGLHALFQSVRLGDPRLPPSVEADAEPILPTVHNPNVSINPDFVL